MTAPRVLFLGSKRVGLRSLEALSTLLGRELVGVVTIDDHGDSRTVLDEIEAFCASRGLPLTVAANRNEAAAAVRRHSPTLGVVCGWYWLVEPAIMGAVPNGFVGVHFSALPKYRGGSPLVWQIINDEPDVGVSLFSLTDGVDEGPVWAQVRIPLGRHEYVGDVLARLEDVAVRLVEENVPLILTGRIRPAPQNSSQATYGALRRPGDGQIDWNAPARAIYNFVRAQARPYPGAFTYAGDAKITIWRGQAADVTYYGMPGQVVRITPQGVWVICGDHRPLIVEHVGVNASDMAACEAIPAATGRLGASGGFR